MARIHNTRLDSNDGQWFKSDLDYELLAKQMCIQYVYVYAMNHTQVVCYILIGFKLWF